MTYESALGLAALLAFAAAMKLRDLHAATAALAGLGFARARVWAPAAAATELATALLLVLWPPLGAVVGLALLTFFTVTIAERLRRGLRAPCGCFGAVSTHPLSVVDIVRNVGLFALALLALFSQGPHRPTLVGSAAVVACISAGAVGLTLLRRRLA
ncbi:MAG: MauE/DoxX family redox-associated membrane protein [Acidimicrobiales bacterium]